MTSYDKISETNEEWKPIDPSISLDELIGILTKANVPLDQYGKGAAKKVDNLHKELTQGESVMRVGSNYELSRDVNLVWVDVICTLSNGDVFILREDRQEFKDGRTRRRSLPSSLGEKMKADEDTSLAAMRALSEEIGVDTVDGLYEIGEESKKFTPDTYPGLESTYKSTSYVALIPEAAYKAEGYVEYQAEKDNFYVWEFLRSA